MPCEKSIPGVLCGLSHAVYVPQARGKGLWQEVPRQVKLTAR